MNGGDDAPRSRLARWAPFLAVLLLCGGWSPLAAGAGGEPAAKRGRPSVLVAMSDDQSWPHASAYGATFVRTPNFDRVASEGVLFTHAFCPSPGCSPSRAAFLTGLPTWQIEHAGTHASYFPDKYPTFPDLFERAGYFVGFTGKGWGPGSWEKGGRRRNPAGEPFRGRSPSEAFSKFLAERPDGTPFLFWFGSHDPHRAYDKGSGLAKGKRLADVQVPPFLPEAPEVRADLLDYAVEIERFDNDVGALLRAIESAGELENTIVIVTSDNGMPFPAAKANCYESGIHVPLAIRWGARVPGGRVIDDLVGFIDLTATLFEAAGVAPGAGRGPGGRSFLSALESGEGGVTDPSRTAVFAARERHSSSRYRSLGYPQRCIRTRQFLFIRNFAPERWPAGAPQKYAEVRFGADGRPASERLGPAHGGYHDIDACPTLDFLIAHREDEAVAPYFRLAVSKRPPEELFDVLSDPGCRKNLADDPAFREIKERLSSQLMAHLRRTGDPRAVADGAVWESYPRVSGLRWFPRPGWAEAAPESVPPQPWLEKRRPR